MITATNTTTLSKPSHYPQHQDSGKQRKSYSRFGGIKSYDIGLIRPVIIPPVIVTTAIKVLKKNIWKCLRERKVVSIGLLRLSNLPQLIVKVVKVVDIDLKRPVTTTKVITEFVDVSQV